MGTIGRATPSLVGFVVVLAAWQIGVAAFHVPKYILPPPSDIARSMALRSPDLLRATKVTAEAAFCGFCASGAIGTSIAVAMSLSKWLERAFYPYAVFLQTVPIVAIAPLLVLWFGPGLRAVTVAAFVVSVFPVIANTLMGIRSVEPSLRDIFRLYRASPAATLFKLQLPFALPGIVTGLRIAAGLAVVGAIVGEFVAGFSEAGGGLGIMILASYREFKTDLLFAAVFMSSALGFGLFSSVNIAGYFLLRRWHPSLRSP